MPEVRIDHISKQYGAVSVLQDFSLTIHDGEFFTLLGPSGCGKTTLINLVAGLDELDSGEIYFNDRPISHLSPKDRDIAMVFQSYALYPHKTVFENIAFPLRVSKQPKLHIDAQVHRVASLLRLENLLEKKPAEISGGERQRVALGRALIRQPAVFLMDEPLSNLDAQLRVQTRAELKKIHRDLKRTTIYVTHDQEEALSLSNRLAVLDRGIIQQVGTPHELYRCPANLTVARFIGSPQMNLIRGTLLPQPEMMVDIGQAHIPVLPKLISTALSEGTSREVIVGIRPEAIRVQVEQTSWKAIVLGVEPVGAQSWAELQWGDHVLRAMLPGDVVLVPDQVVGLEIDTNCLHLFDAQTGERLS